MQVGEEGLSNLVSPHFLQVVCYHLGLVYGYEVIAGSVLVIFLFLDIFNES
jgi:tetrahydromethanopterin S-methyltransferase subunit E